MKQIICLIVILCNTFIHADTFMIDKVHSYVGFKVKYLTLTSVQGHFDNFIGEVRMTGQEINSIKGEIYVESINTNNGKRDSHLKSSDFFNLELYPKIKFQTTQVTKDSDQYVALGELEIHGIKRRVSIPFNMTDPLVQLNGKTTIGLTGGLRINRKNYGLSYSKKLDNGGLVVDDFVDIELNIQMIKDADSEESVKSI